MVTRDPVAAVVFDMDGLLIDSEPLWRIAQIEVFSALGVPIAEEDARATTGLRTDEVVGLWFARHPWSGPGTAEVAAAIVGGLVALVRQRGRPMSGVPETLEALAVAGYPLAIASSSPERVIAAVLETLGIGGFFRTVESAEHLPYGKPHPAVYLEAARRLEVPPTACVAVEDSPNGTIAALAAQMRCVAVPDPALAGDRRFLAADLVLPSLAEFRPELLDRI